MSRSGYTDDLDSWDLIKWRGMVSSAIRGKRGQKLLKEALAALDAMPQKALIAQELQVDTDEVCTLGAVGAFRGINMRQLDPEEYEAIANVLDIAPCLAQEIMYENDEGGRWDETPEARWVRMRRWVEKQIKCES